MYWSLFTGGEGHWDWYWLGTWAAASISSGVLMNTHSYRVLCTKGYSQLHSVMYWKLYTLIQCTD